MGAAEAGTRPVEGISPLGDTETLAPESAWGAGGTGRCDSSARRRPDGYVVNTADLGRAGGVVPLSARIQAGDASSPIAAGSAARYFTGAVVADGADAEAMQATTPEAVGQGHIEDLPPPGSTIRRAGEALRAGAEILTAGTRLRSQNLALLDSGFERYRARRAPAPAAALGAVDRR